MMCVLTVDSPASSACICIQVASLPAAVRTVRGRAPRPGGRPCDLVISMSSRTTARRYRAVRLTARAAAENSGGTSRAISAFSSLNPASTVRRRRPRTRACRLSTNQNVRGASAPPSVRPAPPRLILMAGIDQHDSGHVAAVADREPACDDPADRVAHQQVWWADSGAGQALPQFIRHVVEGPPPARRRVAPPEPRAVVHAHPHIPGQLAVKGEPVQHVPADRGHDDHRRGSSAGLQQVQEPPADVGKPPRRWEPPPVTGLGSHLVGGASDADGTERHRAAYQPRSHS